MTTEAQAPDKAAIEQFQAASERTNTLLEELVNKIKQPDVPVRDQEPKEYTRAELEALVEKGPSNGGITVGQMAEYLAKSMTKKQAAELRAEFNETLAQERRQGAVDQKLAAYRASIPGLNDKNSAEFKRAAKVFQELVNDGEDPKSLKTELLAVRIAFPDVGSTVSPQEKTSGKQRSHETAARGDRSAAPAKGDRVSGHKWPDWMEDERAEFYDNAIKKGRYKDYDDPKLKAELDILEARVKKTGTTRKRIRAGS